MARIVFSAGDRMPAMHQEARECRQTNTADTDDMNALRKPHSISIRDDHAAQGIDMVRRNAYISEQKEHGFML